MFGRIGGLLIGLIILATGFGLWKPAVAARYEHVIDFARLPLADFGAYRAIVAFLIMAVGLVVALASLQRETSRKSSRPVPILFEGEEEPAHPASGHAEEHATVEEHAHEEPAHELEHAPAHH